MADREPTDAEVAELAEALGQLEEHDGAGEFGASGGLPEVSVAAGPGLGQVGAEPLGSLTGAPPWTQTTKMVIPPATAVSGPARIVAADRASRNVTLTAPSVGFAIYVGNSGVQPGVGIQLPAALPYDLLLPGGQDLYAISDAPVFLNLQIQVAPLLIGDRERAAPPAPVN